MLNISFFSYKGGAGRTSLLYNTASYIAEKLGATGKSPVIILDLDIDSKGLSYLLGAKSEYNTIDILKGNIPRGSTKEPGEHPFFNGLAPIGVDLGLPRENDNAILFASAHATNAENKYLNNSDNFDGSQISLKSLNRLCADMGCKAILMDAPAGGQVSGRAALNISKKIVTVMRITKQFRDGTYEFLSEKSEDYIDKEFILVPNAVPDDSGTHYNVGEMISEIEKRSLQSMRNGNKLNTEMLHSNGTYGINEVGSFKFEENNLRTQKRDNLAADEKIALEKFRCLAEVIVK